MNFDNDLMLFFRTIYEDSADMDECSAKVKSAVAAVADKLDIGGACSENACNKAL